MCLGDRTPFFEGRGGNEANSTGFLGPAVTPAGVVRRIEWAILLQALAFLGFR